LKTTSIFQEVHECNTDECNWWHITGDPLIAEHKASPEYYRVEYRTGEHLKSGSLSEMRIKFAGTKGATKSYTLGSSFVRGQKGRADVPVIEDIGLLHQIELIAHGPDGWNPVDFINVHTPDGQVVQFRADFVLTTTLTNILLAGVYGSKHFVKETAVLPQECRQACCVESCPTNSRRLATCPCPNPAKPCLHNGANNNVCVAMYHVHQGTRWAKSACHAGMTDTTNQCARILHLASTIETATDSKEETHDACTTRCNSKDYTPREYTINYETGGKVDSTSPMFVQLVGTKGETRFYSLGEGFVAGESGFATLKVTEEIGLLKEISLEAGGPSSWTPSGSVLVTTPSAQIIAFDMAGSCIGQTSDGGVITTNMHKARMHEVTQLASDSVLHGKYAGTHCYNRRVISADKSEQGPAIEKNMEEQFGDAHEDQPENSTFGVTRAPTMYVDPMLLMKKLDYSDTEGLSEFANGLNSRNTAYPTNAPTNSPTVQWCRHGNATVPNGWQGAGADNQYCNLCHCRKGLMWCGARVCGLPFGGIENMMPSGAKTCSHTKCAGEFGVDVLEAATNEARVLAVHHHHAETNGDGHRCAYNKFTNKCTCYCWKSKSTQPVLSFIEATSGRQTLETVGGYHEQHCESISFKKGEFDPAAGAVRVVVTASESGGTTSVYVEAASSKGFRACVQTSVTSTPTEKKVVLNYHAWQGRFPFDREQRAAQMVQAGQTELHTAGPHAVAIIPGTTQCKLIKFEKSFAATVEPIVLGSIDRNSKMHDSSLMAKMDTDTDDAHVPVTFWIENINRIEFKVLGLSDA
jgi:hypothetical protein